MFIRLRFFHSWNSRNVFPWDLIPLGNSLKIQFDKSYLYVICPTVLHYAALPIGKKVGRKVNVGLERKVFFLKI